MKAVTLYCILTSQLFQRNYYYLYFSLDEAKPVLLMFPLGVNSVQMYHNNTAYKKSPMESNSTNLQSRKI